MRRFFILLVIVCAAYSLPYWTEEDFQKAQAIYKGPAVWQRDIDQVRADWQSWSYIHELIQTSAFIAAFQIADSLDTLFGGIIEGEDELNIVQTDNTQEAIWVWSRYYEITGDTTYFENLRRAWIYVMNFPAYEEEGETDYYRVWNCGLGLFAEGKYRAIFNDSTYFWYSDSCARYILAHPLDFNNPIPLYQRLHPKVTSMAGGMLYQYGLEVSNQSYQDTALAYGDRVRVWIEADPQTNLNDEAWAMSGGTCVWGMCRSIFHADTAAGIAWLSAYLPLMKYFQPSGQWCNSWNIWYANAYNHAARILQSSTYVEYHHALTDSMLVQDYDDDGGVPPTRGWDENRDHTWVSSYMVFMGFEGLMDSIKNLDAGVNGLWAHGPREFFLLDDSVTFSIRVANFGFNPLVNVYMCLDGPLFADTTMDLGLGQEITIDFSPVWIVNDTGYFSVDAYSVLSGDERPSNDTLQDMIYVRPLRQVDGLVYDQGSGGITADLYFQFIDDSGIVFFDSASTDSVTGTFSVSLIDSLYRAFMHTEIPYPDPIDEGIYVTPDSISDLTYYLEPADVLIMNRDDQARYARYFEEPLDTLGLSFKTWAPVKQGIFPLSRIDEFTHAFIIWYSGDAQTNTMTSEEQDSMITFLENSGKLLITGQNIGQDINGTNFFNNYLYAQLVSDSIGAVYCYPDTSDPLGSMLLKVFTTGTQGAQNQYSRDVIASSGNSDEFLFYDTNLTQCAGLWYDDPAFNYQVVYFSFGIEAIHKRPNHMSRTELIAALLDWFDVLASEERSSTIIGAQLRVFPNPVSQTMHIVFTRGHLSDGASITIYDAAGRVVAVHDILLGDDHFVWDLTDTKGRNVSSGIYFVELSTDNSEQVVKTIVIR